MRLADWLEKTGTTQDALARAIGTTQGRVSQILNGDSPSLKLAAKIAKATKGAVTANDFVGEAAE